MAAGTIAAAEIEMLIRSLDQARAHCLEILDGLPDQTLRRSRLPSGWSALGMIQHLTYDIERFWLGAVICGDRAVIDGLASGTAWEVVPETTAADLFATYRIACARSNAVLAGADLDAAPTWWPDSFGAWSLATNREVVLHVLAETAGHAGHLDAWRELVDGSCGSSFARLPSDFVRLRSRRFRSRFEMFRRPP